MTAHRQGRAPSAADPGVEPTLTAAWDHRAVGAQEMRTKRLRLTQPVATDSAGVFAILGDPRTVEHNPSDRLEDRGEAPELVARWVRHWEDHGFGYWCVRESGSDRIIGYAGVKRMLIHGRPVLNLVYRFVPEVWDGASPPRPPRPLCRGPWTTCRRRPSWPACDPTTAPARTWR